MITLLPSIDTASDFATASEFFFEIIPFLAANSPFFLFLTVVKSWVGLVQIALFLVAFFGFAVAMDLRYGRIWAGLTAVSALFSYGAIGFAEVLGRCGGIFVCRETGPYLQDNVLSIMFLATLVSSAVLTFRLAQKYVETTGATARP